MKDNNFQSKTFFSVLRAIRPILKDALMDENFPYFTAIDMLYDEGIKIPSNENIGDLLQMLKNVSTRIYKFVSDVDDRIQFAQPPPMDSKQTHAYIYI